MALKRKAGKDEPGPIQVPEPGELVAPPQQESIPPAEPVAPEPAAVLVMCEHCEKEAIPDPEGIHACARCRRKRLHSKREVQR
jgi:hypothetical protein